MVKLEFKHLDRWKAWFDTGSKSELIDALAVMEGNAILLTHDGPVLCSCVRKPFIEYAIKKLGERFPGYENDYVPF